MKCTRGHIDADEPAPASLGADSPYHALVACSSLRAGILMLGHGVGGLMAPIYSNVCHKKSL
ncbi:hypothetical protein FIBSPDRAFT_525770 [Athelia psychrophila]|uniref:Uncharacterized protein n=1 Tax=Athelia psychrophila TaxID=1759441 RepID=A0A166JJ85_9AGAM|nr:hypothetical protein FIBSPDRAFT_525770 [Fibularhizoctonia sp. CBS 109695]